MIEREFVPEIHSDKCRLCQNCVKICPSGAISFSKPTKAMSLDAERCIDCRRCTDACQHNAITLHPRSEGVTLAVDVAKLDEEQIMAICKKVGLSPGEPVCACSFITAKEVAGAVLLGAKSPEDVCAMTGMRRGCGIYCLVNVFKLLEAGGAAGQKRKTGNLYHLPLSPLDIPDERLQEIDEAFPQFRLYEDVSSVRFFRGMKRDQEGLE